MQPKTSSMVNITRVAKKEITLFFASPIAYVFLATFAAVTLFVFFWGESYFARNIADVRPLFEWMPILLIFLAATLTMRLWSEERRTGTLEYVFTQAVPLWHFVVGKFLGCLFLLAIALVITLPLPITISLIGELDWGPVLTGYLATLLMGAAYLSIGLFVSARSENQIVSLISASVLCGIFYVVGTSTITNLFANDVSEWFRLLGTGTRFESINRGVIDLRDLYYYFSIIIIFLSLNTYALEKERWATQSDTPKHFSWRIATLLFVLNAVVGNLWLGQLNHLRVDVTEGDQYSISDATRGYLQQLQEPLLIRGYFSSKTHPLLAPLVPQMKDLISEYEIAGSDKVRVEFIDPLLSPEKEQEANQKYGIQPVPFQMADRYQSSIVSSYFNVLIEYGDEHQVLGFRELIEIQARNESDIDVQLRNPEHDLTRGIKKVLQSYQSGGNLFATVKQELVLDAYISEESLLPAQLNEFKQSVLKVADNFQQQSSGRLQVKLHDPEANGGEIGQRISEEFGFQPMATSLLSQDRFYFYLTLTSQDQIVQIPIGDLSEDNFKRNLEAGIKRFASGFTKTVAFVAPKTVGSPYSPYGQQGAQFSQLKNLLSQELNVVDEELGDGEVSGNADIVVLVAPKELDEKSVFALDQFLMKGGTVVAATSPYSSSFSNRSLSLQKQQSGLEKWLEHHGLAIQEQLVLDTQNSAFPIPVSRNMGGFQFQEMRMLDYPYFIDVRGPGLNQDNLITSELPQATMVWASPIQVDDEKNKQRQLTPLLHSSQSSWLSNSLDIMPKVSANGLSEFAPTGEQQKRLLGVISQGQFESFFADKKSPLLADVKQDDAIEGDESFAKVDDKNAAVDADKSSDDGADESAKDEPLMVSSVIERSAESARIILFSSNDFLRDQVLRLAASSQQSEYLNTLQMSANAVDWSLEDSGLLSIRSRGHFNRTLPPMEQSTQVFWEYLNYGLAALLLLTVGFIQRVHSNRKQRFYAQILGQ
jgi:gliding motility-associated transport system permease protein/gliding motility-associatede transport system auxiliary component